MGGTNDLNNSPGQSKLCNADATPHDPHRVFISYSRSDFYFAEQLAASMRRRGLVVWFDVHELLAGTDWSSAIDQAIAECDTFVLVASRAALASPYVQRERDLATELNRPCIAVLPHRLAASRVPGIPVYDLTSSFRHGVDQLAGDLATGQRSGRRRRLPVPFPAAARVVALSPAGCTVFAVALGVSFAKEVVGYETDFVLGGSEVSDANRAVAIAVAMIVLVGGWSVYVLWAFSVRRVSWLSLRGSQFVLPLMALVAWLVVDVLAGYVTTDPLITALGGTSEELHLGDAPVVLWCGVLLTSVVAAFTTPYAPGLCRHLKTGAAPNRMRRRHIGVVPRPSGNRGPARSYRLIAADDDSRVADEIRSALTDAGLSEPGDGEEAERQIVVVSDRTPTGWLSWDNLRGPIAVVATSVALPVRGVLQQSQWVDYRRRRRRTLAALGRDLTTSDSTDEEWPVLELPERLQQFRLPPWVAVVVYVLISMATLATVVAAYPLEQRAFTDQGGNAWPAVLCAPIALGLVLLAQLVRRRRITLARLLAVVALSWLGMAACGLNWVVKATFSNGSATDIAPSVFYPLVSAVVFGLAWRSLRRWLPLRVPAAKSAQSTLGSASGSWPWRVAVVPLSMGLLTAANVTTPIDTSLPGVPPLLASADDVCRDRTDINALLTPIASVNEAVSLATRDTVRSAVERRIQVTASVIGDLEGYEPAGGWGADMTMRLIAAYERVARADQAYLDAQLNGSKLEAEYEQLRLVFVDFNAPFC